MEIPIYFLHLEVPIYCHWCVQKHTAHLVSLIKT